MKIQKENAVDSARTLSGVLWDKFLDSLECMTWGDIFSTLSRVSIFIVSVVVLLDTRKSYEVLLYVANFSNFIFMKAILVFALVFWWKMWVSMARRFWGMVERMNFWVVPEEVPSFYWIPVVELVEYLFSGDGTFRRDDVERRFAIPRNRFDEMAKKMDAVKIFVRGENNSRILNRDFSREDVSSMIFRAVEDGELRPLIRAVSSNHFTSSPSMPSLSSGFVTRRIDKSLLDSGQTE